MQYFQLLRSELCVQIRDAVMLPPGWARLGTNLASTGSAPLWKTMGIVVVADFAASAAGIPGPATITLT